MINDEIAAEGQEVSPEQQEDLLIKPPAPKDPPSLPVLTYTRFADETQLKALQALIDSTLSEPYTLYTYRYFVYQWPELCFFASHEGRYVGVVVCKLEPNGVGLLEGYIAMLAVDKEYRKQHIGRTLVIKAIEAMVAKDVDLVVLEAEYTNKVALALYESLGFIREKRLFKHYGNGADAFRLTLGIKNIMLPFSMECYEDD